VRCSPHSASGPFPSPRPRPTIELPADPGLTMLVYTAEPGSPTADALTLLASWAATNDLDVPAADLKPV